MVAPSAISLKTRLPPQLPESPVGVGAPAGPVAVATQPSMGWRGTARVLRWSEVGLDAGSGVAVVLARARCQRMDLLLSRVLMARSGERAGWTMPASLPAQVRVRRRRAGGATGWGPGRASWV